jgi:hypothetical protein
MTSADGSGVVEAIEFFAAERGPEELPLSNQVRQGITGVDIDPGVAKEVDSAFDWLCRPPEPADLDDAWGLEENTWAEGCTKLGMGDRLIFVGEDVDMLATFPE